MNSHIPNVHLVTPNRPPLGEAHTLHTGACSTLPVCRCVAATVEGAVGAGFEAVFVAPKATLEKLQRTEPERLARSPHMYCEEMCRLHELLQLELGSQLGVQPSSEIVSEIHGSAAGSKGQST